jgi:hypothetical protein
MVAQATLSHLSIPPLYPEISPSPWHSPSPIFGKLPDNFILYKLGSYTLDSIAQLHVLTPSNFVNMSIELRDNAQLSDVSSLAPTSR